MCTFRFVSCRFAAPSHAFFELGIGSRPTFLRRCTALCIFCGPFTFGLRTAAVFAVHDCMLGHVFDANDVDFLGRCSVVPDTLWSRQIEQPRSAVIDREQALVSRTQELPAHSFWRALVA